MYQSPKYLHCISHQVLTKQTLVLFLHEFIVHNISVKENVLAWKCWSFIWYYYSWDFSFSQQLLNIKWQSLCKISALAPMQFPFCLSSIDYSHWYNISLWFEFIIERVNWESALMQFLFGLSLKLSGLLRNLRWCNYFSLVWVHNWVSKFKIHTDATSLWFEFCIIFGVFTASLCYESMLNTHGF